jgi:hypothetical protein
VGSCGAAKIGRLDDVAREISGREPLAGQRGTDDASRAGETGCVFNGAKRSLF